MNITVKRIGKGFVKIVDSIVNLTVLTIIVSLVIISCYAMWDSDQVYQAADARQYEIYKPEPGETASFEELRGINPEVFSWLTVYGTNIDYPVTQGINNMKYVNTDVKGEYSLSGSIFLDSNNSKDYSDFNSIIYGHHMEKQMMFGELDRFADQSFFDSHRYGSLFYDGEEHGLEFFAFLHTNAYDKTVFWANVQGEGEQQEYLAGLLSKARYVREMGVNITDKIVLLSTCSSDSTNGRDILIGRITDESYEDSLEIENKNGDSVTVDAQSGVWERIPLWLMVVAVVLLLILLLTVITINVRRKREKE